MDYYGIDLGTSNCLAARLEKGWNVGTFKLRLLTLDEKTDSIPSVVSFLDETKYVVGAEAAKRLVTEPDSTVELIKIRLGQTNEIGYYINGTYHSKTPQEITSLLLRHINEVENNKITRPVITVPAFFEQSQKSATKQAAQLVNMEPEQLIEEPTAALIYHIYKKYEDSGDTYLKSLKSRNYLVFDFGGGTLDLSFINIECTNGEVESRTISVGGDPKLGGNLIDFVFTNFIMEILHNFYSNDSIIEETYTAFQQYYKTYLECNRLQLPNGVSDRAKNLIFIIKREAERVKQKLSIKEREEIVIGFGYRTIPINRKDFEQNVLNNPVLNFKERIQGALKDMDYHGEDINEVLLVGGSSQIPYIQEIIRKELDHRGIVDRTITKSENPMTAVAMGAAIQSALRQNVAVKPFRNNEFASVVSRDLIIDCGTDEKSTLVAAGTSYPFKEAKTISLVIPHALALSVKLNLFERVQQRSGNFENKRISNYTFRLPLYYTGDHIAVAMNIDEAGLYTVAAKHLETGETVVFESEKEFVLSEAEIKKKSEELLRLREL